MGRWSRCITPSVLLALLAATAAVAATTGANSSTAERPLPLWPAAFSAASYHMTVGVGCRAVSFGAPIQHKASHAPVVLFNIHHPHHPAPIPKPNHHTHQPFPQALQDGGDASPLVVHAPSSLIEGRWDYHPAARRQRLAYSVPVAAAEGGSDGASMEWDGMGWDGENHTHTSTPRRQCPCPLGLPPIHTSTALLSLLSSMTERERQETTTVVTLVELWRGHDELYVFSPEFPRACALLDWVSR